MVEADCPGSPRELLADGNYSVLVPTRDLSALARVILQILDNPLALETLRQAVRPFEIEAVTDSYLCQMGLESPAILR